MAPNSGSWGRPRPPVRTNAGRPSAGTISRSPRIHRRNPVVTHYAQSCNGGKGPRAESLQDAPEPSASTERQVGVGHPPNRRRGPPDTAVEIARQTDPDRLDIPPPPSAQYYASPQFSLARQVGDKAECGDLSESPPCLEFGCRIMRRVRTLCASPFGRIHGWGYPACRESLASLTPGTGGGGRRYEGPLLRTILPGFWAPFLDHFHNAASCQSMRVQPVGDSQSGTAGGWESGAADHRAKRPALTDRLTQLRR